MCSGENFCCRMPIHLMQNRSVLGSLFLPLASGYTCYRDSLGKPQCRPPNPKCATPDYVVCSGENFCCRMSIVFALNWPILVNSFSLLAPGYNCYRDSGDNPRCSTPTTTIQPTLGNTALPDAGTALGDPGASQPTALGGPSLSNIGGPGASNLGGPTPSPSSINSGASSSSAVSIVVDAVLTLFAGVGLFVYLS